MVGGGGGCFVHVSCFYTFTDFDGQVQSCYNGICGTIQIGGGGGAGGLNA